MTKLVQTVFVVDDDVSFLSSMRRLLKAAGYHTECFASASEFLKRRREEIAGCVVADLQMPGMNGLLLQNALKNSGHPLPVVFLSGNGDIATSVKAMRQGAEDFLVKTAPKDEIFAAIDRALARDARERRSRYWNQQLCARFEMLSPREIEILAFVVEGQPNKAIANKLGIDERSVKRHRSKIMAKLDVDTVAEMLRLAFEAKQAMGR